jgi:hypothetical protein
VIHGHVFHAISHEKRDFMSHDQTSD